MNVTITEIILLAGFIVLHFSIKLVDILHVRKKYIMSFAAGVGVSYVVVHLLPTLARGQAILNIAFDWHDGIFNHYGIYLIVWLGFLLSYISHRLDEISAFKMRHHTRKMEVHHFHSDMAFFALYHFISGYLLVNRDFHDLRSSIIYFSALGLHFLMIAWGLSHHHGDHFEKFGKWVLSLALLSGGFLGIFVQFDLHIVYIAEALITGAMLLNSIRFELPIDHKASIGSFLTGTVFSTLLFLLIQQH